MSASSRQRRYKARRRASGKQQKTHWLDKGDIEAAYAVSDALGYPYKSQSAAVSYALKVARLHVENCHSTNPQQNPPIKTPSPPKKGIFRKLFSWLGL